jgi:hypothetical protein
LSTITTAAMRPLFEACAADVRRKTRTCLAEAAGKGGSSTNAGLIGLNRVDCSGDRVSA